MKSIELFAGAGGLGMGLHRAGFHPVQVVERDPYCCDTIRENKARAGSLVADWTLEQGDVRAVDFSIHAGKLDLVSGGPPCQPFSMGGKHRAYDDARDMFPEAIRAVREARPRAFVFENVKGLTRASFQNYFEYIQLQMRHPDVTAKTGEDWTDHYGRLEQHHTSGSRQGLNYRLVTRLLNAANHGVPQKRERVLFVGFRDDLDLEWSFPVETHSAESLLWDQYRDGSYWERHEVATKARPVNEVLRKRAERMEARPIAAAWRTVRDAITGLPDPEHPSNDVQVFANHRLQPGARCYPGHTGSPLDEPAKTLKAGVHGVPGGENMLLKPSGAVRYFTVRESARLQTFPDDYVFHGSWSETMRQLGNAVPVRLAEMVGKDVARRLRFAA
ncbi:MAG: DNA cytosine methyltransferase [Brevundimonas sp.]|uniref:DNA cytosine methyltransferase n=1 Tax=Brevundimonas sp. TaxID=1871086 RepID=UPI0025BF5AFC|nr:DNA cytosine methyltransferase [Brevundimonas sp.]MBX3478364.1 DNA cytosine methyltransferase [Brevundimonas sp.]